MKRSERIQRLRNSDRRQRCYRRSCARPLLVEAFEDRVVLTLFVDADASPGHDGFSWTAAFDDLQQLDVVFN